MNSLLNFREWLDENEKIKEEKMIRWARSSKLNDFMHAWVPQSEKKQSCYIIDYSESYTVANNQNVYRLKGCLTDKDKIAMLLYNYATGMDTFKNDQHWQHLVKYQDSKTGKTHFSEE